MFWCSFACVVAKKRKNIDETSHQSDKIHTMMEKTTVPNAKILLLNSFFFPSSLRHYSLVAAGYNDIICIILQRLFPFMKRPLSSEHVLRSVSSTHSCGCYQPCTYPNFGILIKMNDKIQTLYSPSLLIDTLCYTHDNQLTIFNPLTGPAFHSEMSIMETWHILFSLHFFFFHLTFVKYFS